MINKIVKIAVDEVSLEPAAAAAMLDAACARSARLRATGLVRRGDILFVCLEELEGDIPPLAAHVFAPFENSNDDGLAVEIDMRWHAGFSLVGGFEIGERLWALFAADPRHAKGRHGMRTGGHTSPARHVETHSDVPGAIPAR